VPPVFDRQREILTKINEAEVFPSVPRREGGKIQQGLIPSSQGDSERRSLCGERLSENSIGLLRD
jgi:hypothetical protein